MTIEKGVPNLTGLFSLQNVTPIHVAPSVRLCCCLGQFQARGSLCAAICTSRLPQHCGNDHCVRAQPFSGGQRATRQVLLIHVAQSLLSRAWFNEEFLFCIAGLVGSALEGLAWGGCGGRHAYR